MKKLGTVLLSTAIAAGMGFGASLVPEQAVHAGISFQDLVVWMVDNAECDA